jgi:tetratricopeptide (TPR) repeat protein
MSWALATDKESGTSQKLNSVELADRAAGLTENKNAEVLDVLAIAYASAGRFDEAITYAAQAQRLSAGNNPDLKHHIDQQLECFQAGQAWTDREQLPGMIYSSFKNP